MSNAKMPWYREPYVWLLIGLPGAAVAAGIVTLWLALESDDGLVVDDYYRQGLEINRRLAREDAAAAAALSLDVRYDAERATLDLELGARPGFPLPAIIDAALLHATRAGFDREFTVHRVSGGHYRADNVTLPAGSWHVDLGTEAWRITRRLVTR